MKIGQCGSQAVRRAVDRVDRQMMFLPAERGGDVTPAARQKYGAVGMTPAASAWQAVNAAFVEREPAAHAALHPPST